MDKMDKMDLAWGTDASKKFVTNVGLISTNGPHGYNVMACEFTHHISYKPGLIMICFKPTNASVDNLRETKEFGVNLAAVDQNVLASIAGGSSGRDVDKIKVLEENGFEFYQGKEIDVKMIKGASLNVECKLVKEFQPGSHICFIGEAVDVSVGEEGKESLIYHGGKYYKFGEAIVKPGEEVMSKIKESVEKNKKGSSEKKEE